MVNTKYKCMHIYIKNKTQSEGWSIFWCPHMHISIAIFVFHIWIIGVVKASTQRRIHEYCLRMKLQHLHHLVPSGYICISQYPHQECSIYIYMNIASSDIQGKGQKIMNKISYQDGIQDIMGVFGMEIFTSLCRISYCIFGLQKNLN